ncbi:putative DNA-binding protein [Phytophthora cinnamomi]|uniref:putative DNA-binding protein n=1 Tax=Phytophthora cinnamomi TaxID=4785 RepID=UPI00355AA136|nr:putative DNA-binding protein [Phytophthora cinnamomi]
MSTPGLRREWSPGSPVSDRVWAQAIHAVAERRLTLRQAAQAFGLQHAALHRLVRQHTLQQARRLPPTTRSLPGSLSGTAATSPTGSDDSRSVAPVSASTAGSSSTTNNSTRLAGDRYVFPRLNPLTLGRSSPTGGGNATTNMLLPTVAPLAAMPPLLPPACELSPDLNDEVVAVLREQFLQQQQYEDYETSDGRYHRLEGYADADIADVARAIVGRNGRRALPPNFPTAGWLDVFKRENDFVDVDDMVRARSRSSNVKTAAPSQLLQQERYNRSYELELQRRGDQLRWVQNRAYRQPAAPPPLSPRQQSPIHRRASYSWDDVEVAGGRENLLPPPSQQQPKHLRFYQQPQRDESKYRRSASAGSTNGQSDGNASERNYRQSNLVPAKVWERAMEDVAIHGMSLRNAAKAHGVHFAALHRRLKKRQQHKLSTPCEPNYIPFEDEAGIVRVIHARAEMGVLMTFTELVDLLRRTALKHRSELPDEISTALVRKFQSRVEQSIRHLVIDWPALPSNVLYRLRDTSSAGDDAKDGMIAGVAAVNVGKSSGPSIISARSGEGGSLSSSGSSSSLSPHPQVAAVFPAIRKSPVATAPAPAWSSKARSGANSMGADSSSGGGNNSNVNGINDPTAATVPPPSDEKEAAPSMILRL